MAKVRISTSDPRKVELKDGGSVTVKGSLDFKSLESFSELAAKKEPTMGDQARMALDFLKSIIMDWDFVDASGQRIPFSKDLVESMDVETVGEIVTKVLPIYSAEKKN